MFKLINKRLQSFEYACAIGGGKAWSKVSRPLDTKQVISETLFPANLLARYWENQTQQN